MLPPLFVLNAFCFNLNPDGLACSVVSPPWARRWSMLWEYDRRMCRLFAVAVARFFVSQ